MAEQDVATKRFFCANELGEGIAWDELSDRFLWTDIQGKALWQMGRQCKMSSISLPYRLASFALTTQPDVILAAFDCGIARFRVSNGDIDWIVRPDLPPGVRFNDGRTDRSGRFVVGTMVEDRDAAGTATAGCLYRLEADGRLTELLTGLSISNALCFSEDRKFLFHADTPTGELCVYRYEDDGLSERRVIRRYGGDEGPDGACIDANGNIWIAIWGGGRIECLAPDGKLLSSVPVPASQPTCPAFGGAGFGSLAVTTAWQGFDTPPPGAGDLYLIDGSGRGLAEIRIRF